MSQVGQDVTVFHLYRTTVFKMHEQQVKHVSSLVNVQRFGDLATCVLPRLANDDAGMPVPARSDFVSNVLHVDEVRLRAQVRDESPASGDAFNVTFVVQLAQRPIRRHPGDVHRFDQLMLGRDTVTGL